MAEFLQTQSDYLRFLYSLSFLLLASICLTLHRRPDRLLAWHWLGWFGLSHSLHELLETMSLHSAGSALLNAACLVLLSLSYLFLVEFGRCGVVPDTSPRVGRWLLAVLAALSISGGFAGWPGLAATSRYFLGLAGGCWAGLTLYRAASWQSNTNLLLRAAGLTMICYGLATGLVLPPAPLFPASWLSANTFSALTGFPLQVGRSFLAVLLTFWLGLFRQSTLDREADRHTRNVRRLLLWGGSGLLLLILSMGWLITQKWGQETQRQLHQDYDHHIRIIRQVLMEKMREADQLVQALAGSSEIKRALTGGGRQELEHVNTLLDRFSQVLPLSVCYLLDLKGFTIASSNRGQPDSFVGQSYADRHYFQMAEAGSPDRYLALGPTSRERGYYSSYPVWGPHGNVLGVAVLKRPLAVPEPLFHEGCLYFLIDPQGVVFLSNQEDLVLKSLWPLFPEVSRQVALTRQFGAGPFPAILDSEPAEGSQIVFQGQRFLIHRYSFPYQGWSLVHLGPMASIAVSRLMGIGTTLILCLALLGLLLGWDMSIEATARLRTSERNYLEELRQREEQYRRLFADAGDGILIADLQGNLLDANKKIQSLLGYSRDELIDMHYTQIHPPEALERTITTFQEIVRQGSGNLSLGWVLTKDGRHIPVEISGGLITYGVRTVVQSIFRDISERRKSEEERLRLSKLESLGVLAGGIAHDFNNILTAILGNLSLAMMTAEISAAGQERLREAEKACARAQGLARQLLTFAKGGRPIRKIAALDTILKEAAGFTLSGSRTSCQFSLDRELWPVEVDEGQLTQVINNLLLNADQAMPEGGIISLQAENVTLEPGSTSPLPPGKYVKFSVTDQGVGIPEKYLDKIFDPYFTTKKEGSGLGLATAYAIIKNHQGHIAVESQPGVGTRFTIFLPAVPGKVPDSGKAPRRRSSEKAGSSSWMTMTWCDRSSERC